MSRSYTSRPAVSRALRGSRATGQQSGEENERLDTSPTRQTIADRTERRDAYTVIVPDEQKRKKLQQQAADDERKLQQYRDTNRIRCDYVGAVGGIDMDNAIEQQSAASMNTTAGPRTSTTSQRVQPSPFEKSRQYRAATRQREETELAKKKQEQRQKAAANEERERLRKEKLDEDRKKKTNAFLDRFENKSKQSSLSRQAAADAMVNTTGPPARIADPRPPMETVEASGGSSMSPALEQLRVAFPEYGVDELNDLLAMFDGDVDASINALT